ncbi:MAG: hypothetical protein NZ927_07410 [Candidatus Calescibacterium sp.]|nr:hypothetical protein [Candidatus Calescibacterium sp.]MDW8087320.1 hypothetical protein [Candidatus Calescibacterium sp.]
MVKSFQDIRIELSSKNPKSIYFFSFCPKILFDELVYTLRTHFAKNAQVVNVSPKTSIFSEFFNYDFFSGRKILILDWDLISPSKQQSKEIIQILLKYEDMIKSKSNVKMNFLLVRSYMKQIDREIYKYAKDINVLYWVSWKLQDAISVAKSKFPDVKFLEDADLIITDLINRGAADIVGIIKKAVLYAYPRRYISGKDISNVVDLADASISTRESLLKIILGDKKEIQNIISDEENLEHTIPQILLFLFSVIKLKAESKHEGFIDKYKISQELRIKNIDDKILKRIKSIDEFSLSPDLLDLAQKSRLGFFQRSVYLYHFLSKSFGQT